MPEVIFLTAHDAFAIRAFEAEALDYLLKPVSEERFAATIERLTRRLRKADASIAVATPRGVRVFPLVEIDWIEAADNYARLWVGERSYLVRRSLSELERGVAAHGFARAHRQALVRLAAVRALEERDGELIAVLNSGATIRVSRRRRAALAAAVRTISR
jgi:two-component system LytT family response regulator